jgi:dihydrofolate reductase
MLGVSQVMVDVVYYVASSLDGYVATADGSVDWLSGFHTSGEDHGLRELNASVDALLLGSHTYEFALKLRRWPSPDKSSWVFTLTAQTPREVINLLASRGLHNAWLMGGGKLAASFHSEQLISRYIILVFPVLLGSGIPLFAPHSSPPDALQFRTAKPFPSGIVVLTYDRALSV